MTSSTLLKVFSALAAFSAAAYAWLWYSDGEPPTPWLIRFAAASFLIALVAGVANADTRPRLMLRFLAALFALFTLISFAADVSRPRSDGEGAISLLHHLEKLTPALVSALERTVTRISDSFVWDPVLTTILSLPATMIFLLLAVACGYLGRPRRRVRIFANDY
ncbi:MAG: hypothetical protein QM780_00885 [Hyphomicrobium sp.]|uniref:hypothetical protein n=1 Tax=Hyphomicrobium sp. TaxID=82 RepID=UPI0039E38213